MKVSSFRFGGSLEKCVACSKTVYAMEKKVIDGKILHGSCFKCAETTCARQLNPSNFAVDTAGTFLCKQHHKQRFTLKGSYDPEKQK